MYQYVSYPLVGSADQRNKSWFLPRFIPPSLQTSPRLIVFVRTSLRPRVSVLYVVKMHSNTGRTRQKKIKSTVTGLSSEYVVNINHISSQPAEGRESIRPHRCISSSSGPVIDKAPLSLSTAAMSSLSPIVPCRA